MEGSSISFVVDGEVRPKERPRFTRSGVIFTPKRTLDYENKVKSAYLSECPSGMAFPECPVELRLDVFVGVPKSYSAKKKERMIEFEFPTKKPDVDNMLKAIADALNGVAYTDDKQVVLVIVRKFWSLEPRAEITLREVKK